MTPLPRCGRALLLAVAFTLPAAAAPRGLVLILADDHRYDALGFLGHPFLETPHLDRLAREGVHAARACVTTALCSPSRASILTGLHMHRHGVVDNVSGVRGELPTFPQLLQAAGYRTGFFGKWHMGTSADPRPGFHRWVSFRGQGEYAPAPARPGAPPHQLNIDGVWTPRREYITDELTTRALDWLATVPRDQPFLLYLSRALKDRGRLPRRAAGYPVGSAVVAGPGRPPAAALPPGDPFRKEDSMAANRFTRFLDERGIPYTVGRHPPAFTAAEAAVAAHVPPRCFAKTLVLRVEGAPELLVLPASRRVLLPELREMLGTSDVRLASERELRELFPDCEEGATPPLGPVLGLKVHVVAALTREREITFHAGSHTETITVAYPDFERLVHPVVIDLVTA